jgi:hypothetical protein
LNSQFETELRSILSGVKPTFPSCKFLDAEWYPRSISILHSFFRGWDLWHPRVRACGQVTIITREEM